MMNEQEIQQLKEHLAKKVAVVVFKKADGSIREMQCTLAEYLLPETKGTGRKSSKDVLVVFDLEKEEWRSFRTDSVIEVFLTE
jgi:hypothetical protein